MKGPLQRIEDCSPERRRLIEQLLIEKGLPHPSGQLGVSAADKGSGHDNSLPTKPITLLDKQKEQMHEFYNSISQQLDSSIFGESSYFLNYGYVAHDNRQYSTLALPDYLLDKNSIKLVLETIGEIDISDSEILDVGCGRGGTIFVINKYYDAKRVAGIDLSSVAISSCKKHHGNEKTQFVHGDAENLPFEDGVFDYVINVESSHSYPDIHAFYSEVFRVLRKGGCFLYTDCVPTAKVSNTIDHLHRLSFVMERNQDITTNVLFSCDEIAARRLQAFNENDDGVGGGGAMNDFLGVPGSSSYDGMKSGQTEYRIFRFRKQ